MQSRPEVTGPGTSVVDAVCNASLSAWL